MGQRQVGYPHPTARSAEKRRKAAATAGRPPQHCRPGPPKNPTTTTTPIGHPPCEPWEAGKTGRTCGSPGPAAARSRLLGTRPAAAAVAAPAAAAAAGAAGCRCGCPAASLERAVCCRWSQHALPAVAAAAGQAGGRRKGARSAHCRAWRHRRRAAAGPPRPRHPACRELSTWCRSFHDAAGGATGSLTSQKGFGEVVACPTLGCRGGAALCDKGSDLGNGWTSRSPDQRGWASVERSTAAAAGAFKGLAG